jgi:pentatricopeptide repeat protein
MASLQEIRQECLRPIIEHLVEKFSNEDCRDMHVPEPMKNLLIAGRQHGPWNTPEADEVTVYLRGGPGNVSLRMDYIASRPVLNSSRMPHCQNQSFKLDANAHKYFFSGVDSQWRKVDRVKQAIACMEQWRDFEQSDANITLDDLARRVIDEFPECSNPLNSRSNPNKGRIIVKQQLVDFVQDVLDQVRPMPISMGQPLIGSRKARLVVLRFVRDCAREVFFNSTLGRECLEHNINMEPQWANGALVFVQIQNPWTLPLGLTLERYHVLIEERDLPRLKQALREGFPYKKRPRYEIVWTFDFKHENTSEIMAGYAEMLRNGFDFDVKTFTKLIHMCCKENNHKDTFTLLYEMEIKGIQPSGVTCNCVLKAFYKSNPRKADKFVTRMTEKWGLQPTELAYDVVIKAYKKQRNFAKADEWETKAASHYPGKFGRLA